jgi:Flp pilus assembly protein protease CpaA
VCEDCATRAKGRLGWQFGLLGAASVLSSIAVLWSEDPIILALVPPVVVGTFAVGTIAAMKLANRRAQAQIAMGSYPFLQAADDRVLAEAADE